MSPLELTQISADRVAAAANGAAATDTEPTMEATATERSQQRGPVCIVDDDVWVTDSLGILLETHGFTVLTYTSGSQFLGDRRHLDAKCLVVDQHMPGLDGVQLINQLHREGLSPPTILITGRLDAAITQRAAQCGVLAILEKPFPVARLVELVGAAISPHTAAAPRSDG